jgi:hypothetical protein
LDEVAASFAAIPSELEQPGKRRVSSHCFASRARPKQAATSLSLEIKNNAMADNPAAPGEPPPPLFTPPLSSMRTFGQKCVHAHYDTYQGRYGPPMLYFAPAMAAQQALTAVTLLQTVLHTPINKPLYFAACIPTGIPIQHKIVIIHHFFQVPLAPGETSSHEGRIYGFCNDLIGRQLPILIQVPADGFTVTTHLNRPLSLLTPDALRGRFNADINLHLVEVDPAETAIRSTRVRRFAFNPSFIAAALMGEFHTPRIAYAALEQRGIVPECEPLMNWLVAACTTGANHIPLTVSPTFERPIPDTELYAAALAIVDRELPGVNQVPAPTMTAPASTSTDLVGLAQAVTAAADALSNATLSNRPAPRPVRSPRTHFGSALDQVLFLTLSESEHHLPALFWDISDVTRTQHIGVITNRLTTMASRMQMAPPLVTKLVSEVVTSPHFSCPDRSNLMQGLSPFLFLPRNATERAGYDRAMRTYRDLVDNGNVNATDAARMDALDTSPISIRSHSHMRQVLGHFHIFLHALFQPRSGLIDVDEDQGHRGGAPHPFLAAWDLFWQQVQVQEPMLIDICDSPGVPFAIVRWIQVRTALYAHD